MAAAEAQQAAVRYQGVDKASFGYKLLANLGWREGEGLVRVFYPAGSAVDTCYYRCHTCITHPYVVLPFFAHEGSVAIVCRLKRGCRVLLHCAVLPQGANKQGIAEHIKVKKKFDALGVGAVSAVQDQ